MVLQQLRSRITEMVRTLPGLWRMEHNGRRKNTPRKEVSYTRTLLRLTHILACACLGNSQRRRAPHQDAILRTQPRPGWRSRSRKHHTHRRRTRHRQINPRATEHPIHQVAHHTLRVRRGERETDQDESRPHRASERKRVHCLRDIPAKYRRTYLQHPTGARDHRFHPDHRLRRS